MASRMLTSKILTDGRRTKVDHYKKTIDNMKIAGLILLYYFLFIYSILLIDLSKKLLNWPHKLYNIDYLWWIKMVKNALKPYILRERFKIFVPKIACIQLHFLLMYACAVIKKNEKCHTESKSSNIYSIYFASKSAKGAKYIHISVWVWNCLLDFISKQIKHIESYR